MKTIIIGGVAAGMSAASKLKRTLPDAEITVYERGSFLSYGACGIPYYIGGVNEDPDLMIARSRDEFEKQGIKTHLRHEAIGLNPEGKEVRIRDLDTGRVFEDRYDRLMIAVGCDSAMPPVPGADMPGVFYIKSLEDGLLFQKIVSLPNVKSAIIVGGGYIGIEMAEALLERKINVTLIEGTDRLLAPFEPEFSRLAGEELERHGVKIHLGEPISSIRMNQQERTVTTTKGTYSADLIVMCVGVVPATGFLKGSGIRMAKNGALMVDREMRTSLDRVYAAGDCAVVYNRVTQEDFFLPLGTVANKCGRLAGGNMAGGHDKFVGALGTAAIKVCGLELARTGMSEQDAKRVGKDYDTTTVSVYNHPAYYPGRQKLTIKLLYEKNTGCILGANAAGGMGSGAVLRVDMFAIAIHTQMSAADLGMVDLAYAPPFSGVWDAVHIAANTAK